MPRRLRWCLLWLGLPLLRVCPGLSHNDKAQKLCGRHLLRELVEVCGAVSWSPRAAANPLTQLLAQAAQVRPSIPDALLQSSGAAPAWGSAADPVSISASREEAIKSWVIQSLPDYQYKKASLLPEKLSKFSSLQDTDPYIHEVVEFQKKNKSKIKALSSLFWGDHPQRKRRGYSEKCCIKGCTREELFIACLPYTNYKKKIENQKSSFVTKIL